MADQRYLVTARKYRPALFKELVAQEHVTDTLKNAIRLDRLAHAYLFSGPRGVGKTTAARILAKSINCTTPLEEREDQAEPCRTCDSCQSFEEGRSLNIFEIDAASNNKVDDVRDLRETVRIPPQGSKKKVYIIDEVHMLSKQAFNALLKTLEEPPSHALFIFATTEPHKVLPTILSRCQRFDFHRIPVPDIVERLRAICKAEDITADEESLMLIARKGDGALRDALSAFDQAVSLCGDEIEYGELAQAMGVVDLDLYFTLTNHVADQNSAGVLRLVDEVVRSGYDLQEFLSGLSEHLRNLLVARTLGDFDLIEAASATRERYAAASQAFTENALLRLLMIVGDAEEDLTSSTQPRLKLEMALLRMAALTQSADLREALQKIDRLEQMARDGTLPDATPAPADSEATPARESSTEVPSTSSTAEPDSSYEAPAPPQETTAESSSTPPAPTAPSDPTPESEPDAIPDASSTSEQAVPKSEDDSGPEDDHEPEDDASDEPGTPAPPTELPSGTPAKEQAPQEKEPATGYRDLFGKPALQKNKPNSDSGGEAPEDRASSSAALDGGEESAVATAVAPDVATDSAHIERLRNIWMRFVQSVKQNPMVYSHLRNTEPIGVQEGTIQVAVPDKHHRRQLRDRHRLLVEHLSDVTDVSVDRLRFIVQSPSDGDASGGETPTETDPYERMRELRRKHPVIEVIFDEFGGELVW